MVQPEDHDLRTQGLASAGEALWAVPMSSEGTNEPFPELGGGTQSLGSVGAETLQSRLTHWAAVAPNRLAVVVNGELTYAQLLAKASSLIDWEPGRVVAIRFSNSIDFACAYVAGILSGATIAILDPAWPKLQLDRVVSRLQPSVVLTNPSEDCWTGSSWQGVLRDLSPVAAPHPLLELDQTNRFLIAFTSGTTSEPKGYSRTRRSWEVSLLVSEMVLEAGVGTVTLAPGPMSHGVTLYALTEALFSGGTFVSMSKFDPYRLAELAEDYGVTRFIGVPTHYRRFPQNASWLRKMKTFISAGERMTEQTSQRILTDAPQASLIEYYGASELSFVSYRRWAGTQSVGVGQGLGSLRLDGESLTEEAQASATLVSPTNGHSNYGDWNLDQEQNSVIVQSPETTHPQFENAAGTIPFPGVEIEIRALGGAQAQEAEPLAGGECGVIWVRSEFVIEGYLSEQDSGFRRDGDWATVGDLGRIVDGRLEIVGREGGMVTIGGNNVYLSEVEEALNSHPALTSAAVIALPDDLKGKALHAVLLADDAAALVKADLLRHLSERLPKYKIPAHFHTIPAWPLVGSGKMDRKALQIHCSEGADEWKPDEL